MQFLAFVVVVVATGLTNAQLAIAARLFPDTARAAPFKVCGCGRSYTASSWRLLRYRGVQEVDETLSLELRDCACRSTIAVEIVPSVGVAS